MGIAEIPSPKPATLKRANKQEAFVAIIDFRIRPPYKGFLDTAMSTDLASRDET